MWRVWSKPEVREAFTPSKLRGPSEKSSSGLSPTRTKAAGKREASQSQARTRYLTWTWRTLLLTDPSLMQMKDALMWPYKRTKNQMLLINERESMIRKIKKKMMEFRKQMKQIIWQIKALFVALMFFYFLFSLKQHSSKFSVILVWKMQHYSLRLKRKLVTRNKKTFKNVVNTTERSDKLRQLNKCCPKSELF